MQEFEYFRQVSTTGEAVAIVAVLKESGIPYRILDEGGGPWSGRADNVGPAHVLVASENLERAGSLLKAREQALDIEDFGRDRGEAGEDDYWNAPEAFAPFEGDAASRPDEMRPRDFAVLGPLGFVCLLYFSAVFGVSFALGRLIATRGLGL